MAIKPVKQPDWPASEAVLGRAEEFLRGPARGPGLVVVSGRSLDALSATALLERFLRAQETQVPELLIEDLPWKRSHVGAGVRALAPKAVICIGVTSTRRAVPAGIPALVLGPSDLPASRPGLVVLGAEASRRDLPLSLLTWFLTARVASLPSLEWLALLGTLEEAGLNAAVPGYQDALKRHGRVPLTETLTTVRAASLASTYDPADVVRMLLSASKPLDLALGRAECVETLRAQRDHVERELKRACQSEPLLHRGWVLGACRSKDQIQTLLAARLAHLHPERVSVAINTGADRRVALASVRCRQEDAGAALVDRLRAEGLVVHPQHRRGWELSLPQSSVPKLLEAIGLAPEALDHTALGPGAH